jgi:hypothetical protein
MPFFVFLIEVSWEFNLTIKAKATKKMSSLKQSWMAKERKPERIRIPYQGLTQCMMIGLTLAFFACYCLWSLT